MPSKSIYVACILLILTIPLIGAETNLFIPDTLPSYFRNPEYQTAINKALYFRMRTDSLRRVTEERTAALKDALESQKTGIRIAIRDNDAQATAAGKQAGEWFALATKYEGASTEPVVHVVSEESEVKTKPEIPESISDSSKASGNSEEKTAASGEFAILPVSPYSTNNPIPVDRQLPEGVVYKIQLGAFGKPVSPNIFKGLTPISGEKTATGITKYFAGLFRRYEDAEIALRRIHEYGFKQAYIVAFHNKKAIAPERAKQLENK